MLIVADTRHAAPLPPLFDYYAFCRRRLMPIDYCFFVITLAAFVADATPLSDAMPILLRRVSLDFSRAAFATRF